ncbi:hypothetical protein [Methanobrevibacter sp.]|uniref:hypothetical protein n=1 Tax=Methanobrevibacter sp. TaxID=66852 RepID=UPI0026DEACE2|nr:hypothetical protein [Methanobrevibacter sp.]MDO5859603.1 hypothetical protein [Methanobrevibacter sp.]
MNFKRTILLLSVLLILISVLGVCASDEQNIQDIQLILDSTDESDMIGCCSVVLQLDGNNSIFSFRRDANLTADIHIEEIDWHGIQAIKQYKTEGGYFCQVIITSNGWTIGYGGVDDGPDNEKTEEITSHMITEDNSISEDGLAQIEKIKKPYKLGHVVIKAPNGNYGIAGAKGHFTGHLNPGEYISMPNTYNYFRSGDISLDTSDKISVMTELAASDAFGLTRRDITTYYFHQVDNDTFKGNITDAFLSNDDGSIHGMNTGELVDNVYFNNTLFEAEKIPIAPNYESMGSMVLKAPPTASKLTVLLVIVGVVIFIGILFFAVKQFVRYIKFRLR